MADHIYSYHITHMDQKQYQRRQCDLDFPSADKNISRTRCPNTLQRIPRPYTWVTQAVGYTYWPYEGLFTNVAKMADCGGQSRLCRYVHDSVQLIEYYSCRWAQLPTHAIYTRARIGIYFQGRVAIEQMSWASLRHQRKQRTDLFSLLLNCGWVSNCLLLIHLIIHLTSLSLSISLSWRMCVRE